MSKDSLIEVEKYLSPLTPPEDRQKFLICLQNQQAWLDTPDANKLPEATRKFVLQLTLSIVRLVKDHMVPIQVPAFHDSAGTQHVMLTERIINTASKQFTEMAVSKDYSGIEVLAANIANEYFRRQPRNGKTLYLYTPLIVWIALSEDSRPRYCLVYRGKLI